MVLELSLGASSPKKQGHLHRWLENVRYQAIADLVCQQEKRSNQTNWKEEEEEKKHDILLTEHTLVYM